MNDKDSKNQMVFCYHSIPFIPPMLHILSRFTLSLVYQLSKKDKINKLQRKSRQYNQICSK